MIVKYVIDTNVIRDLSARSNDVEKESPAESVAVKIEQFLTNSQEPETEGVIVNRCRPHKKELVLQVLEKKFCQLTSTHRGICRVDLA